MQRSPRRVAALFHIRRAAGKVGGFALFFLLTGIATVQPLQVHAANTYTPIALRAEPATAFSTPNTNDYGHIFSYTNENESSTDLKGWWKFSVSDNTAYANPSYDDSNWAPLFIPGTWNAQYQYAQNFNIGWLRHTFTVPASYSGTLNRLKIRGIYCQESVYINGTLIGSHWGISPHEFSVPNTALNFGGNNTIAIRIDPDCTKMTFWGPNNQDKPTHYWWYWGGINEDIELVSTNAVYVNTAQILADPNFTTNGAAITVTAYVTNTTATAQNVTVKAALYTEANNALVWDSSNDAALSAPTTATANSTTAVTLTTTLPAAKTNVWSFDHLNLYVGRVRVSQGGTQLHGFATHFGIRRFEVKYGADDLMFGSDNKGGKFYLNNQPIRLAGGSYGHISYPGVGGAYTDAIARRDVDLMKEMGANFNRFEMWPVNKNMMDYMDKAGIMNIFGLGVMWNGHYKDSNGNPVNGIQDFNSDGVINEKDAVIDPRYQQQTSEFITDNWNRPQLIGWSDGNEGCWPDADSTIRSIDHDPQRFVGSSDCGTYASANAGKHTFDSDHGSYNSYWTAGQTFGASGAGSDNNFNWREEVGNLADEDTGQKGNFFKAQVLGSQIAVNVWSLFDYKAQAGGSSPDHYRTYGIISRSDTPGKYTVIGPDFWASQDALAPFNLATTLTHNGGNSYTTTAALTMKSFFQSSAYTIAGYTLTWKALDANLHLLTNGQYSVPTLSPAEFPSAIHNWNQTINWTAPAGTAYQTFEVTDPSGYRISLHGITLSGADADATVRPQGDVSVLSPNVFGENAAPAGTTVIDNGTQGYNQYGTWKSSTLTGYNGSSTLYMDSTSSASWVKWLPTITTAGTYTVSVYIPASTSATTHAHYSIIYSGGAKDLNIDQTQHSGWYSLGTYTFTPGTAGSVSLVVDDSGIYRVDAAKFDLVAASTTLFSDNFESGSATQWTPAGGTWAVVTNGSNHVYAQTNTSTTAMALAGSGSWTDYTVQADITVTNWAANSTSGLVARYTNSTNFYLLRLTNTGNLELGRMLNGTFTVLDSANEVISLSTVYTLKLTLQGSNLVGYINGAAVVYATDPNLSSGSIGVRAYNAAITLDNVVVTAP